VENYYCTFELSLLRRVCFAARRLPTRVRPRRAYIHLIGATEHMSIKEAPSQAAATSRQPDDVLTSVYF
jgi:hypothetical protein